MGDKLSNKICSEAFPGRFFMIKWNYKNILYVMDKQQTKAEY